MSLPRVTVDFQLMPDGEHTFALLSGVVPADAVVAVGATLIASDDEVCHLVVVDSIDLYHGTCELRVLWDAVVPAA